MEQKFALSPVPPDVLDSCSALTGEESNTIEDFVNTLDKQIADIDAQLQHLNNFRKTLSYNRAVHRNRLSLVHRMPDELLIHVFHVCLLKPPVLAMRTTLNLSHVCRRWRKVVASEARIWSVMDVAQLRGGLLDLWLARSGDSPLTVLLDSTYRRAHPIIFQQSHRLRAISADPENLRDLSDSGNELPMLRVLHCRTIYHAPFSTVPFTQITHLATRSIRLEWAIAHMPNLLSLDVDHNLGDNVLTKPLVHPRLQYLKLRIAYSSLDISLYQFDFPSLIALFLINDTFSWASAAAIQAIIASTTSLDTLVLHNTYPPDTAEILQLLKRLPGLQKLHLQDTRKLPSARTVEVTYQIMEALSSSPNFLPKLKILTLSHMPYVMKLNDGALARVKSERSLIEEHGPFGWVETLGCPGDGEFHNLS